MGGCQPTYVRILKEHLKKLVTDETNDMDKSKGGRKKRPTKRRRPTKTRTPTKRRR